MVVFYSSSHSWYSKISKDTIPNNKSTMALDLNDKVLVQLFMWKSRASLIAFKMDYFRRNLKGVFVLFNDRIQPIRLTSDLIIKTFSWLENILRVVLIKIVDDDIKRTGWKVSPMYLNRRKCTTGLIAGRWSTNQSARK